VWTVSIVALTACSFRHRLAAPYPATLPVDQQVQVWHNGQRVVLSHVTMDSAVVRGLQVPWRPACGACTLAVPLVQVDSIVLVNHELGWMLAGTAGLLTIWVLNHCWPYRACFD
jgi:hypothetical protein